jgi:SNF family Na+-dependent transporter
MELGRIVLMVQGEKNLFIRRTWLTKIFVTGDVVSFFVQASGAGLLASGKRSSINAGNDIVIGGLFIQIVFFGLFVVASMIFHIRMKKAPTQLASDRPWTKHMVSLYIVSILIFVRSIVRAVEYIEGQGGYLMSHEVYLYVFDGVPMYLAVVCMIIIHPGEVKKYVRQQKASNEAVEEGQMRLTEMA